MRVHAEDMPAIAPRIESGMAVWELATSIIVCAIWPVLDPIIIGLEIANEDGYRGLGRDDWAKFAFSALGAVLWFSVLFGFLLNWPVALTYSCLALYALCHVAGRHLWKDTRDIAKLALTISAPFFAGFMLVGTALHGRPISFAQRFDSGLALASFVCFAVSIIIFRSGGMLLLLVVAVLFYSYGKILTTRVWESYRH